MKWKEEVEVEVEVEVEEVEEREQSRLESVKRKSFARVQMSEQ